MICVFVTEIPVQLYIAKQLLTTTVCVCDLVINCPREDFYDVILSEMMANTTVPNIQNTIKGADDSVVTTDTELDYTRRIRVTDVRVVMVKKSLEKDNKLYQDSLIVVTRST